MSRSFLFSYPRDRTSLRWADVLRIDWRAYVSRQPITPISVYIQRLLTLLLLCLFRFELCSNVSCTCVPYLDTRLFSNYIVFFFDPGTCSSAYQLYDGSRFVQKISSQVNKAPDWKSSGSYHIAPKTYAQQKAAGLHIRNFCRTFDSLRDSCAFSFCVCVWLNRSWHIEV